MAVTSQRVRAAIILASIVVFPAAISRGTQDNPGIRGFAPARVAAERALEQQMRAIPDPARAESNLRRITSEPHMAGTEASHRVAEWLRDQYRSFGFDADIVSYSVWLAQPREVQLELTAPDKKTLATPEQPFPVDPDTSNKNIVAAFNTFSPSADVTAPVVYLNYGMQADYRELEKLGISVAGEIDRALWRLLSWHQNKTRRRAQSARLIIYSDPEDDGYVAGDVFPNGPWRPMSGIQRGSVEYTEIYPGDPLTPGVAATANAKRLAPADATNLAHIPTLPINSQDASVILENLGGAHVPRQWQGGLPFTYHVGPGAAVAHMKLVMDYQQRTLYDVIAKLRGANDAEWVVLGNHHDAWVYGAVDPGSGTATMLETARAFGELVRAGWKPRRTIVMCEWDGEEPGLMGSTEWVEANRAELQAKAVAYLNTDVGVAGPNFTASATPSLKQLVREVTREVQDPRDVRSVYNVWLDRATRQQEEPSGIARPPSAKFTAPGEAPIEALGAGSDFCPFFDHAGIPSLDAGFIGDYGVYHSMYDDFYWMKKFGDPTFEFHVALAKILGTLVLRLDESDTLPFDYSAYAAETARAANDLATRAAKQGIGVADVPAVSDAAAQLTASAARASQAMQQWANASPNAAKQNELNRDLVSVEQALLAPEGLSGRTWYKHTIYAPGTYAGYAAEVLPGANEALDRQDAATFTHEAAALAAALQRASARLEEIARLASSATR